MKTNAHRPSHRVRWLLLKNKILTKEELLLFEFYIDQMDFDPGHKAVGTFEVNFVELAILLGYSTTHPMNAIRNKHKKLLKLGFIHETNHKNIFAIHNYKIYIAQTDKWKGEATKFYNQSKNKSLKDIIHLIASNVQLKELDVQPNEQIVQSSEQNDDDLLEKNVSRYLISSKVDYLTPVSNVNDKQIKSISYYEALYKENDLFVGLVPEDMKWLDDHFDAQGRYRS